MSLCTRNSVWSKCFPLSLRQGAPSYLPKSPGLGWHSLVLYQARQTYPSIWIRNHQQNRMLNSLPQLLALLFVNIHLQFVQLEMSIMILIASLRCPDANVCRGSLVCQSCRPCRDWIRIFNYTECVAANTDTCQVTSSKPHTSHAFLVHWCTLLSFTHLGSDLPEAAEAQLDFAQTAQSWGPQWRNSSW